MYQVAKSPANLTPNAFWGEFLGSIRYSTSSSKCIHIRNPCIRVAQCILACSLFAHDDSLNVLRLSKLYFLSCMLDSVQLDPGSFLARQLHSATVSTKGRIVIGGIITTIARFLGVEPNPEDRVSGFERLDQADFDIMNFCKVEASRLYWICPGDRLLLLPNVDHTTLLHQGNLYWIPSDDKVLRPVPHQPTPHSSQEGPNSSSQLPPPEYSNIQDTLRSIQEEQVSLQAFVASESAALWDFVQERHDELRGLLASVCCVSFGTDVFLS